jgi:putative endonuclease
MEKGGCVYIITNKNHTTLYIGVTSDLIRRIHEHKSKVYRKNFSYRYNLEKLVYYEVYTSIEEAIDREKQLKGGSREKKLDLINKLNPEWKDLYDDIIESW